MPLDDLDLDEPVSPRGWGPTDRHDSALPPCLKCVHAQRCASVEQACIAFELFTRKASPAAVAAAVRDPSRQIYARLFAA